MTRGGTDANGRLRCSWDGNSLVSNVMMVVVLVQ